MSLITFSDFAESIKSSSGPGLNKLSFVDKSRTYNVYFSPPNWSEATLPTEAQNYFFDESTIISTAIKFGLNPNSERHKVQTAELLAKRSAWIASLQSELSKLHKDDICLLFSGENEEICIDYANLTTSFNHPWIESKIRQLINEKHPDLKDHRDPAAIQSRKIIPRSEPNHHTGTAFPADKKAEMITIFHELSRLDNIDPRLTLVGQCEEEKAEITSIFNEFSKLHRNNIQLFFADPNDEESGKLISYWIEKFETNKEGWVSEFEPDAYHAELDIKSAKQKIKELQLNIAEQEAIITKAQRPIRKFKSHIKIMDSASNNKSDATKNSERKKYRKDIARIFFKMWVESLIATLEVESSASLEKMTSINKMTWWRWYNGKTLPPYLQLSDLLKEKIKTGKYNGITLENIPTYPKLGDIALLVRLI